jgi:hypothetical protein
LVHLQFITGYAWDEFAEQETNTSATAPFSINTLCNDYDLMVLIRTILSCPFRVPDTRWTQRALLRPPLVPALFFRLFFICWSVYGIIAGSLSFNSRCIMAGQGMFCRMVHGYGTAPKETNQSKEAATLENIYRRT